MNINNELIAFMQKIEENISNLKVQRDNLIIEIATEEKILRLLEEAK